MNQLIDLTTSDFGWEALKVHAEGDRPGALDIETTVEDNPWSSPPQLVSIAITFDGHTAFICNGSAYNLARLQPILEHNKWIMHNGLFDRLMLKYFWQIDAPLVHDTMAMQYLLDPDEPKSLEELSAKYLGLPAYKGVDYHNILNEPWDKVATMNGEDTCRTHQLFRPLADELNKDKALSRVYQWLLMPAVNNLIDLTINGTPVDQDRLADLTLQYEEEVERLLDDLQAATPPPGPEYGKTAWPQPSSWRVTDKIDPETGEILIKGRGRYRDQHPQGLFNPGSWQQVGHILFDLWELPILKMNTDDDGNETHPSTDKDVLLLLETYHTTGEQQEWISKLRTYRKANKALTASLRGWPKQWDRFGWLHPRFKPLSVVTGRLASESPNIQQVPRDKRFRNCFGGVDGYTWMKADYSQIELRIAAWVAQEPTMLEAYETGTDLHALTARRVLGVEDVHAELPGKPGTTGRDTGKTLNFGLLYGAGPKTLMQIARLNYNVFLTEDEAEEMHHRFFMSYPDLSMWHDEMRMRLERDGMVRSALGRVRYLPKAKIPWKVAREQDIVGHKIKAILEGTNHPVQSFAHDLTLMSLNRVAEKLKGSPVQLMLEIHDEIDLLVPNDLVLETAQLVKATMEDLSWLHRFGIDLTVPVLSEVEVGTHWGDVKEMEL